MANPHNLPLEIIEQILQDLATDKATHAIKNCARACWGFLDISRKHLFETVKISTSPKFSRNLQNLATLLRKSPEVAGHTRHLQLRLTTYHDDQPWTLPTELKMFSKVESYELLFVSSNFVREVDPGLYQLDIAQLTLQLRDVLLHPMLTVRTLKLYRIGNFPFYDLPHSMPNIRDLHLSFIYLEQQNLTGQLVGNPLKLERFCSSGDSVHATSVHRLISLRQSNNHPVLDTSTLQWVQLSCFYATTPQWENMQQKIFKGTRQLETLILNPDSTVLNLYELGRDLLPFRMTLKELHISNHLRRQDVDPLHGLCDALELFGSRPNVLESLSYSMKNPLGCRFSTLDIWAELDRVIDTCEWPKLKKVYIDIFIQITDEEGFVAYAVPDAFRIQLETLPNRHLPLLSARSKEDFDFQFRLHWD